jgi:hypothetical protein
VTKSSYRYRAGCFMTAKYFGRINPQKKDILSNQEKAHPTVIAYFSRCTVPVRSIRVNITRPGHHRAWLARVIKASGPHGGAVLLGRA